MTMKKSKKFATILFLLAVGMMSIMCLFACGWRSAKAGSYYFYSMSVESDGVKKEYQLGDVLPLGVVATQDFCIIRLKSNGGTLIRFQWDRDGEMGTWETIEGEPNKITITIDGESVLCECDGSTLVMYSTDNSNIVTFKK